VGQEKLHFVSPGLGEAELARLSVTGHAAPRPGPIVQSLLDEAAAGGKSVAVLPEGPYCAPLPAGADDAAP
jgi:hypothetical protein